MEQNSEGSYAIPWLIRRQERTTDEPDPDYLAMLEELCRGQQ